MRNNKERMNSVQNLKLTNANQYAINEPVRSSTDKTKPYVSMGGKVVGLLNIQYPLSLPRPVEDGRVAEDRANGNSAFSFLLG
jgi:hypothetical protein